MVTGNDCTAVPVWLDALTAVVGSVDVMVIGIEVVPVIIDEVDEEVLFESTELVVEFVVGSYWARKPLSRLVSPVSCFKQKQGGNGLRPELDRLFTTDM